MLVSQKNKLKKKAYIDQIISWIEQGECDKVIAFFEEYSDLEHKYVGTSTNWTPAMYACRYGRQQLFEYFISKNHQLQGQSPYTLIHAACFGNEYEVLKYLLDVRKMNPTPLSYETTPLKFVVKCENYAMVELLLSRGAYFIHGEFLNNMTSEVRQITQNPQQNQNNLRNSQQQQQPVQQQTTTQIIYKSKFINYDGEVEEQIINPSFVLRVLDLKPESQIRDFIRWFRCRNWLFLCHLQFKKKLDENNEKAKALGVLAYNKNSKLIKQFLVGPQETDS